MFADLVVRDYLQKRGMVSTLAALASEQQHKQVTRESWMAMGTRLSLPNLVEQSHFDSILEVMTQKLLVLSKPPKELQKVLPRRRKKPTATEPARHAHVACRRPVVADPPPRPAPVAAIIRSIPSNKKLSRENWIPVHVRRRLLQRELFCLKQNIDELESSRHAKHRTLSELEQNHIEERYGLKKRQHCGLCDLEFSSVNVVLSVPNKAIQDLRRSWADNNEPHPSHLAYSANTHVSCLYDEAAVCVFCAQFFQLGQQDKYRPSQEKKRAEANRRLKKEQRATARAYWDPIKQLERHTLPPESLLMPLPTHDVAVSSTKRIPMGGGSPTKCTSQGTL